MPDRAIIDHASPTLARLKLGNLFNYPIGESFHTEFNNVREQLLEKGVTLTVRIFLICLLLVTAPRYCQLANSGYIRKWFLMEGLSALFGTFYTVVPRI